MKVFALALHLQLHLVNPPFQFLHVLPKVKLLLL
jgi:hypothetical protein